MRYLFFGLAIAAGAALGILYGWTINPVRYTNTTPDALREDYKADYVLMVGEIFRTEGNVALAARRLDLLGGDSPVQQVQSAIVTAQRLGYSSRDLDTLGSLALSLQTWSPAEGDSP
jgi:hypothetical protein